MNFETSTKLLMKGKYFIFRSEYYIKDCGMKIKSSMFVIVTQKDNELIASVIYTNNGKLSERDFIINVKQNPTSSEKTFFSDIREITVHDVKNIINYLQKNNTAEIVHFMTLLRDANQVAIMEAITINSRPK
jgi:hypothetical protein